MKHVQWQVYVPAVNELNIHVMNTHQKVRELILSSATDGGKWRDSRSDHFTQGMTSRCMERRLVEPQSRSAQNNKLPWP
jgi:hypothetical protein